jgi:holo-[acyl-carrier protein] synthase
MSVIALGIDLVEVPRVRAMLERHAGRFKQRVFTEGEIAYCESCAKPEIHFAARFAAKEAVAKAFGTGFAEGVVWTEIEVMRAQNGSPAIVLHGGALAKAAERGIRAWRLSLSHTDQMAVASVAALGEDRTDG